MIATSDAPAVPSAPAADPPPFRVVRDKACLRFKPTQATSHDALRAALWGAVADVPELGGRIARFPSGAGFGCGRIADDADLAFDPYGRIQITTFDGRVGEAPPGDHDILRDEVIADPAATLRQVFDERGPAGWHELDPTSRADKQIKAFVEQWDVIASMLGVNETVEGFRLFSPGRCLRPKPLARDKGFPAVEWREYLNRHVIGLWGDCGAYSERPLTEAQRFAPVLFPMDVRNNVALASGAGMVRSRFALDAPDAPRNPYHPAVVRHYYVEVLTVLGRSPETLLWISTEDKPA